MRINTENKKLWIGILLIFLLFITLRYLLPFFAFNDLNTWDMTGHYESAKTLRNHLFPEPIGWNSGYLLGFPQNQFYPPLFSYLVALLSFGIGAEAAFKLVVGASILLFPVSVHYFLRKKGFSSAISVSSSIGIFFFSNLLHVFDGGIITVFREGLVPQMLGLTLLFFFFGAIYGNKGFVTVSLLFSGTILSHFVIGSVALIGFVVFNVLKDKGRDFFLKTCGTTFLLVSFWIIPFFSKMNYSQASFLPSYIGTRCLIVLLVLGVIAFGLSIYRGKDGFNEVMVVILSFFSVLSHNLGFEIHVLRIEFFIFLFIAFSVISLIDFLRKEHLNIKLFFIGFLTVVSIILSPGIYPQGSEDIGWETEELPGEERIMIQTNLISQPNPQYMYLQAPLDFDRKSVNGLFIESSRNSRYIFSFLKNLDRSLWKWSTGLDRSYVPDKVRDQEEIEEKMKLFGIDTYVSYFRPRNLDWTSDRVVAEWEHSKMDDYEFEYRAYNPVNTSLVETLDYAPDSRKEVTTQDIDRWFYEFEDHQTFVLNTDKEFNSGENASVDLRYVDENQERLEFYVDSDEKVPVLVKKSYFPNWEARSEGEEIEVYQVAPSLILLHTQGETVLEYGRTFSDVLGYFFSITGILLVIFLIITKNRLNHIKGS